MKLLTELANKYNTDKGTVFSEAHGYTELYDDWISKTDTLKLLEIGIYRADSLRMWREYNPNLDIYAIDIDQNCIQCINTYKNMNIFIGDGTDDSFLHTLISMCGKFDIIIDDGSHEKDHILKSFNFLYSHLNENGVYIIEDLHAAHAQYDSFIPQFEKILNDKNVNVKYDLFLNNKLLKIKN